MFDMLFLLRRGWEGGMAIGVPNLPQIYPPSFLSSPRPLRYANCPTRPIFREPPAIYWLWLFVSPPVKNWIFQWTSIISKFSSSTLPYHLTVTRFLVKISQINFLDMTEKNIFVYTCSLLLNISDFSLFLCKNCSFFPWKRDSIPPAGGGLYTMG